MNDSPVIHQGRAPGLYDEQLQRQQQEKLLLKQRDKAKTKPALFGGSQTLEA